VTVLVAGCPIRTGIIEGACRHLIADRMDITGARLEHQGAEAGLKLRAVRINQDFDLDWPYHLDQERQRVHTSRYHDGVSQPPRSPPKGVAPNRLTLPTARRQRLR
jgi:hypothetical protein